MISEPYARTAVWPDGVPRRKCGHRHHSGAVGARQLRLHAPEFSRGDIPPGDTVKVGVAFDPAGRPGRFEKKVMLTTTAPSRREVLEITGTVIGASSTLEKRFPIEVGRCV